METQRVDLGTYKNNLGRLESKYDDVSALLDEANIEIVEREAGIENAGGAIFDLRAQIDRLNGELAEAESSSTKAEAERDRIQLLFNDSTTGKVSDRKSLSFLSVLTVSSISTKNDRKMTKFFDDEI